MGSWESDEEMWMDIDNKTTLTAKSKIHSNPVTILAISLLDRLLPSDQKSATEEVHLMSYQSIKVPWYYIETIVPVPTLALVAFF